jgi:uncharacterized Rmd1/YagE family protein
MVVAQPRRIAAPRFEAHAAFVGERIDVRGIGDRVASFPPVVGVGERGCAVIFRYGAVVFFDVGDDDRRQFLHSLRERITEPYPNPEGEAATIVVEAGEREGLGSDGIVVPDATIERLQVIAFALAKSVALAQYEAEVAEVFGRIEPLAGELGKARRHQARQLLRHIGATLLIQQKLVGRVEVTEKPELLWEHTELEGLHRRLDDEYELKERHVALER